VTGHSLQESTAISQIDLVKRRLLSGGAWALGGRVALAFIGLATNALLARLLAPADLGVYFLAYSVVGLCTALGAMGLTKAIVRFVAESVGLEQYDRTRRAIKLALSYGSLGAVAVGLAYLLFGGALSSSLFDSPALAAVAGVTAGWISISILQGILVETFRGFHDIRMTATLGGMANGNGVLTGGLLSLMLLVLLLFRGEASLIPSPDK
jgi:O-antigen/teichoic acid export membrane protein